MTLPPHTHTPIERGYHTSLNHSAIFLSRRVDPFSTQSDKITLLFRRRFRRQSAATNSELLLLTMTVSIVVVVVLFRFCCMSVLGRVHLSSRASRNTTTTAIRKGNSTRTTPILQMEFCGPRMPQSSVFSIGSLHRTRSLSLDHFPRGPYHLPNWRPPNDFHTSSTVPWHSLCADTPLDSKCIGTAPNAANMRAAVKSLENYPSRTSLQQRPGEGPTLLRTP